MTGAARWKCLFTVLPKKEYRKPHTYTSTKPSLDPWTSRNNPNVIIEDEI
jgi:hypothetical protein